MQQITPQNSQRLVTQPAVQPPTSQLPVVMQIVDQQREIKRQKEREAELAKQREQARFD